MSYNRIAEIMKDIPLRTRVAACAATQSVAEPWVWVDRHMWNIAGQPGWDEAYESALASHPPAEFPGYRPGYDEAAITDGMILAAVQQVLSTPEPENAP